MSSIHAISNFAKHGSSGVSVLAKDFLKWLETHSSSELGEKIVAYSWNVDEKYFKRTIDITKQYWWELPDASGFICFESEWKPDNCLLLDAYGKERMRLIVPWQMTGSTSPESGLPPTSFANISAAYTNPADGKEGKFGVTAWVEYAGKHYFELDYHSGKFLWCKRIID
jgi:hypothetical protein